MMSGIRGTNTHPEIFIRKGLHALGFRYRLHAKNIPGRPDIVLPKFRALICVNGCFWHGHGCKYTKTPSSNSAFWKEKIDKNLQRDARNLQKQLGEGWRTLIVWECAIRRAKKSPSELYVIKMIAEWVHGDSRFAEIDERGISHQHTASSDSSD